MKKVGILTLGLKDNYGGILQAISLYCFLKSIGQNPVLIRKYPIENPIKMVIKNILKSIPCQNVRGIRVSNVKYQNNFKFWSCYIDNQSEIFTHKKQIEHFIDTNDISALIVGSDQVWRYSYINDSEYDTFFLNLNLKKEIKKVSYAASFGVGHWECGDVSNDVAGYLESFDYISVREKTGIKICQNEFHVNNVVEVLDPTLLVGSDFFRNMVDCPNNTSYDSISYILDKNNKKNKIIEDINIFHGNKINKELLSKDSILSIPDWVESFYSTKMVVTDSFHGMVFSILFEKEFYVIINNDRGADRFTSLCEKLGIMDRLINTDDLNINFDSIKPLDYKVINNLLLDLRVRSSDFLKNALN